MSDYITVEDFGAVGDGTTDDTAAIQDMIDAVGCFRLLNRTYKITDTLIIPANGPYGTFYTGQGMEQSILLCAGMAGKTAIGPESNSSLYRVAMHNFKIMGDCDSCFDFSGVSGGFQLYASEFRNLWLESNADSCFKGAGNFSVLWDNVHAYSNGGHCFELGGDVAKTLINCYAHKAGPGKAGYRMAGNAVMINCNGLDEGDIWGDFGAVQSQDGQNLQFRIHVIGGNIEDFDVKGIRLRFTGTLILEMVGVIPRANHTYETLIDGSEYGGDGWSLIDRRSYYAPKPGAAMSASSRILHNSAPSYVESTGMFTDLRRTDQSLTYPVPVMQSKNPAYGVLAHQFGNVDYSRSYGFNLQVPALWTVNAQNFNCTRVSAVRTANTAPTAFRSASGGEKGQRLTIIVEDANTTIEHNFSSAGRFITQSGSNIAAVNGGIYEFVYNGTNWRQV
ncbi:glycosyl hydrolase family 28-related protein [Sphingopyxis sp.]|uniref:glycosyl hydrolase family 28-related protein n=1 Tax=Sphingopyxis sp. TaxID=1908224 RepID=UPI002D78BC31|nr:hypothetical protein [Sphingopyxis sp.]HET6527088.1 hypothetical protein [Sphingopyxis sp.]